MSISEMSEQEIRIKLIKAGVNNLIQFGYDQVTEETILTDEIYKAFFESMLENNLGNGINIDNVINQLLKEIREV